MSKLLKTVRSRWAGFRHFTTKHSDSLFVIGLLSGIFIFMLILIIPFIRVGFDDNSDKALDCVKLLYNFNSVEEFNDRSNLVKPLTSDEAYEYLLSSDILTSILDSDVPQSHVEIVNNFVDSGAGYLEFIINDNKRVALSYDIRKNKITNIDEFELPNSSLKEAW